MKKTKKVLLIVLILVVLSGCTLVKYKKKIAATLISPININTLEDGIYEGFYDVYLINARVKLEVKNHKIVSLELLEHKHGKFSGEPMIQRVLEKQSLEVDVITGATNSSKTILKAIEIALSKGQAAQPPDGKILIQDDTNSNR